MCMWYVYMSLQASRSVEIFFLDKNDIHALQQRKKQLLTCFVFLCVCVFFP
jgi:hypothetical protein